MRFSVLFSIKHISDEIGETNTRTLEYLTITCKLTVTAPRTGWKLALHPTVQVVSATFLPLSSPVQDIVPYLGALSVLHCPPSAREE